MATTRKCNGCGKEIVVDKNNINGIALLTRSLYYHTDCLAEIAAKKVKNKRHAAYWDIAFENISVCEQNAKDVLGVQVYQDELNDHLIEHYDIAIIPNNFWSTVRDICNGEYRRKKCKPIPMETMCGAWKWGQKNLDKIAANNKTNNKGPKNNVDRLNYDLAIILTHIEDYNKYIRSTKEQSKEIEKRTEKANKMNYEALYTQSAQQNKPDSILDLMNDIF